MFQSFYLINNELTGRKMSKSENSDLYKLSKHSIFQIGFFLILFLVLILLAYHLILSGAGRLIQWTGGAVYNENSFVHQKSNISIPGDTILPKHMESKSSEKKVKPDFYLKWAIDIGETMDNQTRYWLNPAIAVFFPTLLTAIIIALWMSTFLPGNLGFIRQKIDREILIQLDKLYFKRYGVSINENHNEIAEEIIEADLRRMHELSKEYDMLFDELNTLRKALLWRKDNIIISMATSVYALFFYMKFYFTERYNNTVMGMVYIGAAVLIIIIGMRGLKFIPSTEPTLVFFALGLEFSLLLTYAFTLMLSKQENNQPNDNNQNSNSNILSAHDLDNAVEIENLLRMFISDAEKKQKKS